MKKKQGKRFESWRGRLQLGREAVQQFTEAEMTSWRSFPNRLARINVSRMASSISYYMVFAIFPFLLLLLSAVAFFGDDLIRSFSSSIDLDDFFPEPVLRFVLDIYQDASAASSVSAVSVGALTLIWAASKGINSIVVSMQQIYHRRASKPIFMFSRLFSVLLTIIAAIFVFTILIVLAFGEAVIGWITELTGIVIANRTFIRLFSFSTGFAVLTLTFFLIYYFSAGRRTKLRHALLAASLSSLAWVASSAVFSIYVRGSNSLSIYGSMTGIVILMLWLYVCTFALLLGAAFHSLLRDRAAAKHDQDPAVTPE